MPKKETWVLVCSLIANLILLGIILNTGDSETIDTETPALKERNRTLLQRVEQLKYTNDSLEQVKKEKEVVYQDRIQEIYEIPDTDLVDSVRAALSRIEIPTNPH